MVGNLRNMAPICCIFSSISSSLSSFVILATKAPSPTSTEAAGLDPPPEPLTSPQTSLSSLNPSDFFQNFGNIPNAKSIDFKAFSESLGLLPELRKYSKRQIHRLQSLLRQPHVSVNAVHAALDFVKLFALIIQGHQALYSGVLGLGTHIHHPPCGLQRLVSNLVTFELETSQIIVRNVSNSHVVLMWGLLVSRC